jgi:hypothetical protein
MLLPNRRNERRDKNYTGNVGDEEFSGVTVSPQRSFAALALASGLLLSDSAASAGE